MNFNMLHPADQIVMIMNRLYKYGMTTTSGGNLSICDKDGSIWISPSSVDKGSLRREDIMHILPDGTILGLHKPSVEYPFHMAMYKIRPDFKAVLHAHPPALVGFSCIRKIPNTSLIPNARFICGKIDIAEYAVPGSQKLGDNIAQKFAEGANMVLLENHGVCTGADNLFSAFMAFETLEYCARLEINASILRSNIHPLTEKHMQIYKNKTNPMYEEFDSTNQHTSEELETRKEMCKLIHRAYENKLFNSSEGTFSKKLSDGSLVITPYSKDRLYLEPEDLVLIKDGKAEKGKVPSRSVALHLEIYKNVPELNSIIIAHPPNIMAFAVTDCDFDARLIPESYIMLKNVRKFPYGSSFMQPVFLAREVSIKNPVMIIENDCVIVGGTSLLNAFDRLEVMEYSAKSVIDATALGGNIQKISDDEIKEIEKVFNL